MSTVNISFTEELLADIDRVAREESRSRSELIREAARGYIRTRRKWSRLFETGRKIAEEKGLTERDIEAEISAYRKSVKRVE